MTIKSLLPSHFSELEHALDRLTGERFASLELDAISLWNAETCPAEYLPLLAWSLSVDVWNSNWPENIKRQVISESPRLHEIKGTPAAVLLAMNILNIDAEYSEWWQQSPEGKRGTFEVLAYVNENLDENNNTLLSLELVNDLKRLIDSAKRGSQHYTLKTGVRYDSELTLAGAVAPSCNHSQMNLHAVKPPTAEPTANITILGTAGIGISFNTLVLEAR